MENRAIWGSDLLKGFKLDRNKLLGGAINDILPFQMLTLEEKDQDWVKSVADYYEVSGWHNVERKAAKIQRNYWMRYGKNITFLQPILVIFHWVHCGTTVR